jgi:hypothetical protein
MSKPISVTAGYVSFIATVFISCVGQSSYEPSNEYLPPIGVKAGADYLSKEVLFEWPALKEIDAIEFGNLDGAAGNEIGILNQFGVTYLLPNGTLKEEKIFDRYIWRFKVGRGEQFKRGIYTTMAPMYEFVDVEGDGVTEYFPRFDDVGTAFVLMNFDGTLRWFYPFSWGWGGYHAASGDLNNDGLSDFVICRSQTFVALNSDGSVLWTHELGGEESKRKDDTPKMYISALHVMDSMGDSTPEVVAVAGPMRWEDRLLIFDAAGNLSQQNDLPVRLGNDVTVIAREQGKHAPLVLASDYDQPRTVLMSIPDCEVVQTFPTRGTFEAVGSYVSLSSQERHFVFTQNRGLPARRDLSSVHSEMYLFSSDGKVMYRETLPGLVFAIETIPIGDDSEAFLLVQSGEPARLWKYSKF